MTVSYKVSPCFERTDLYQIQGGGRRQTDNATELGMFSSSVINLAGLKCPYFSVSQADDLLLTIRSL